MYKTIGTVLSAILIGMGVSCAINYSPPPPNCPPLASKCIKYFNLTNYEPLLKKSKALVNFKLSLGYLTGMALKAQKGNRFYYADIYKDIIVNDYGKQKFYITTTKGIVDDSITLGNKVYLFYRSTTIVPKHDNMNSFRIGMDKYTFSGDKITDMEPILYDPNYTSNVYKFEPTE